jgi:hypothetical protein
MKIPHLIKLPKYNKFEYKPIYYNENKELINQKITFIKEQQKTTDNITYKPQIKGKIKNPYTKSITEQQKKVAKLRFGIIIVFFVFLLYLLINNMDIIDKLTKMNR